MKKEEEEEAFQLKGLVQDNVNSIFMLLRYVSEVKVFGLPVFLS